MRTVERDDLRAEPLADSEMPPFEADEIADVQKSGQPSWRDEPFVRKRGALDVYADVSCEIEADFLRCFDVGTDDYFSHDRVIRSRVATPQSALYSEASTVPARLTAMKCALTPAGGGSALTTTAIAIS